MALTLVRPNNVCVGLNRSVHEAMNIISNVKVHLKTSSGNENIQLFGHCIATRYAMSWSLVKLMEIGTS